jgi:hypothetical protein
MMVYNIQGHLSLGLCPSSSIVNTTKEHGLETGSVAVPWPKGEKHPLHVVLSEVLNPGPVIEDISL